MACCTIKLRFSSATIDFQTYGSVFIWGPAIVLLIAGYLANRRTWRLTTGKQ